MLRGEVTQGKKPIQVTSQVFCTIPLAHARPFLAKALLTFWQSHSTSFLWGFCQPFCHSFCQEFVFHILVLAFDIALFPVCCNSLASSFMSFTFAAALANCSLISSRVLPSPFLLTSSLSFSTHTLPSSTSISCSFLLFAAILPRLVAAWIASSMLLNPSQAAPCIFVFSHGVCDLRCFTFLFCFFFVYIAISDGQLFFSTSFLHNFLSRLQVCLCWS